MSDNAESQRQMRAQRYNIQITVHSAANGCSVGFKEGDNWLITDRTPAGMCLAGYNALYPFIRTLRYGGGFNRDFARVSCPDSSHCVVFEVKRIPK